MPSTLDDEALDQLFRSARSLHTFKPDPVSDETIHQLHELMKWGPTASNTQPGRFLFLKSSEARLRLAPALSKSNHDKTLAAPLTVLVAYDTKFFEYSKETFPFTDVAAMFEKMPAMIEPFALRNSSLQGAYLILAARSLGLTAGPMSGFNNQKADDEFFPEGRWKSNFLINLGYWDGTPPRPRTPRLAFDVAAKIL
jgi:3-hydroxypropanoate dehydrogenase